jgi:hypothetical protein
LGHHQTSPWVSQKTPFMGLVIHNYGYADPIFFIFFFLNEKKVKQKMRKVLSFSTHLLGYNKKF